ncbi:MAG: mandelate racemase/muconate lactonizing enzyme family protein, partial [Bacteroidales bacterium]|nr:mandelate racemase/muconate lactonizing enzyme family protein [Bacteroidales bacterium]
MKTILQKMTEKTRQQERAEREAIKAEIADSATTGDRRNFLKKAALGGITIGGLIHLSIEDTIAQITQKVSRSSSPSELKITDLRFAEKGNGGERGRGFMRRILRINTNQGIYGLGDIRGGTDQRFAGFLKSKIIGLNPCNVEMIFKTIKQFGFHGRQGSGISAVEMACWDICGKAFGVPVWQLLGGRYRDKIRLYADTPEGRDPSERIELIKNRIEKQGFTWLKMDLGINSLRDIPDSLVNSKFWYDRGLGYGAVSKEVPILNYNNTKHPFTQIQITEKGLENLAEQIETIRNIVGYEIPLSTDHYGHLDMNQFIRLGRAIDKYRLAWLEDCVAWFYTDMWRTITDAIETPT